MERAFIFDSFHTWSDWGLILTGKDVSPPKPKTNYVDLDGMNGSLDLSEALTGEVTYENRTVSASFCAAEGSHSERAFLFDSIIAAIHGRKMKIIEPDDPGHYFYGRVTVKKVKNLVTYGEFSIEAECDPWRYEHDDTVTVIEVDSQEPKEVMIYNPGARTVCPDITVTGEVTFRCCGVTSTATDGQYKVTTFKLFRGENVVTVSGSGTLTLTYRRGTL